MVFTVSGAFAQDPVHEAPATSLAIAVPSIEAGANPVEPRSVQFISREVVQPLPASPAERTQPGPLTASTLGELVASMPETGELSRDMRCLASAIYFESRGEPLLGQLAVGQVIVNRAASPEFPSSYCGVVYQPSQFSFIRGGAMPSIKTDSRAWRNAKAIAQIAHRDLWESPADDALFFHATSVKPRWQLTRVGQVNRHVFYR